MSLLLDALLTLSLAALSWAKVTGATWTRYPYDAPAGFRAADGLAIVCAAALLLQGRFFPGAPPYLFEQARRLTHWAHERLSPRRTVLLLFAGFFGFFFFVHVLRHWSFKTELFDQSFVHAALFWPWDKHPLSSDVVKGGTFLSSHLAFSLFVLTPVTAFVHLDEVVFLLQALVIAVPLWAAFRFGPLERLERAWVPAFLIVACHTALRSGLIWDFREDCLAFSFLLLAMLALLHGRVVAYLLALLLAMLAKEYIAAITFFLALPILFEPTVRLGVRQRAMVAAGTAAVSAAWLFVSLQYLIPFWTGGGVTVHDMVRYFPGAGSTPSAVVLHYLASPRQLVAAVAVRLLRWETLTYLSLLILPFGYFLRRGGWWLVPAVPGILMNILAERPFLRSLAFHYDWVILPFLIMGLLRGIQSWHEGKQGLGTRSWAAALLVAFAFSGSWPLVRYYERFWPSREQVRDAWYLQRLPDEGVLGIAWNEAIPHVSHVREIRMFNDVPVRDARDRESLWNGFWELNGRDLTRIPGHGARESDRLLLDVQAPLERFLAEESQRRGWRLVSRSPSGRYLYLRRG